MDNRLAKEVSPYLQQHGHNPVDWYPWGEEAIERARAEDRPILLSIGYSACHWCHVMERESFDDQGTAKLMNEWFVNVKVDREERPDLDQIYQLTVQLVGRSGGWPLTVFLTPKLEPFYAGTYFPPAERHGMPSFQTVLRAVHEAYENKRQDVEKSAAEITRAIGQATSVGGEAIDPPADSLAQAAERLGSAFDEEHGGFGARPKFPNTMPLEVLLRAWRRHGDEPAKQRVTKALDAMRAGGIWDHLGGGFHRYSTDERWLVPHFEKMLYDNALLTRLYVDAWRATGEVRFSDTARGILRYVVREMRSKEGPFYSTQDADSEGEEGKFFVWTPEQLEGLLEPDEARAASLRWGVAPGGNFEDTGATVLHSSRPLSAVAAQMNRPQEEVERLVDSARTKLFAAREDRVHPFRDEKVIATWNGLMIGAMAVAGGAMGDEELVRLSREGLGFVRRTLWSDGRLLRIYKDGRARVDGFLEDYADVAGAAIDVFEASGDAEALGFARELADAALERFWDEDQGGFFFSEGGDDLIVRAKDAIDNAVPSGTSSICHALLRLHALTDEPRYLSRAETTLRGLASQATEQPLGFGHLLGAIDRYLHGPTQVVVVAAADDPDGQALLQQARATWLPNGVVARVDPDVPEGAEGPARALGARRQQDGRATAYVCMNRTCGLPIVEPAKLIEALRGL